MNPQASVVNVSVGSPNIEPSSDNSQQRSSSIPGPIDVCGKRTLEYVIEVLGRFNRLKSEPGNTTVRSVGSNVAKAMGVSQVLVKGE
jgi:hypothetical protein